MNSNSFDKTVYSVGSFLEVNVAVWGNCLKEHHIDCMQEESSIPQRKAWLACFRILQRELSLMSLSPDLKDNIFLVFEYELPRERGRRPDVLILSGNNLIVLEFKGFSIENQAQIDQVKHYARDLKHYHDRSHHLQVVPILVLAAGHHIVQVTDGVLIVSGDNLYKSLCPFITTAFNGICDWFNGEYAPLPSLLQSAQLLFKEKTFPQIKRAHSAGIPLTLQKLEDIARFSQKNQSHHLALITGVPGAGKTLVGLQFVFETYVQDQRQKAVFLSGNGPLVEVLQFSLQNRNFVQSVHGFLKQYAHGSQLPSEDVLIYDEAQRAWDAEKVSSSSRLGSNAEPTDFVNIASRKPHCLLIGLIGEGQEIYLGEESGMQLWYEAILQSSQKWRIHCPAKLQDTFPGMEVQVLEEFNLTTSLRTHQALTLQQWVEDLLNDRLPAAKEGSERLYEEAYPIYVTRSLDLAKAHVIQKYEDEPNKTYGLLASSKSKILPSYGVKNNYQATKSFSVSQYYADAKHSAFCRNLTSVVTEFGCQGLELDLPILAWDADFVYAAGWKNMAPMTKAKDSDKLRRNSYRVLLTRGRDGLVIFVPGDNRLNSTYSALLEAGCRML